MINLDNIRQWIVWGFTKENHYTTHSHIMEGFYRTLKLTGRNVLWLDQSSDLSKYDFSGSFFITEHEAIKQGIPVRDDCFYLGHGLRNDPVASEILKDVPTLGHNVYHDFSHGAPVEWEKVGRPQIHDLNEYERLFGNLKPDIALNFDRIFLDEDFTYYSGSKHCDFRWASDLTPGEIYALKPVLFPGPTNNIYWCGSLWFVNQKELGEFSRACGEKNIHFKQIGAGQNGVVSVEENIKLVRQSYMAPALSGSHHLTEGYAPCRIFKNISYGCMGITNSKRVNDIFQGRLIYNPDPYELFYQAVEELPKVSEERIRGLMDYVAHKHTYVRRIENILKAARLVLGTK